MTDALRQYARGSTRAVDATVGGGGHAAVLRDSGATVLAIDRDPDAIVAARARLGSDRVQYFAGAFGDDATLDRIAAFAPDLVLLDLGVSGHQLDRHDRGFTFRLGAPLDMRMSPGQGPTAADLLNTETVEQLTSWFKEYGDEPRAGRLARAVARRRAHAPFAVSDDLVGAIRAVYGPRAGAGAFARIFQALRMAVNDETGQLERALPALREALIPGGTLLVISYHSGEDRIVKRAFRDWSRSCVCPPRQPVCTCRGRALGAVPERRGVRPNGDEVAANPRARSARLRVFVKSDAV